MLSVPLIRCLPKMSPSSSTSTGSQIATWRRSLTWTRHDFSHNLRSLLTGKMFVWLPAFLTKPGSARYSSAPSITTVWSNYQTSYNDFFVVYNSYGDFITNPFDQFSSLNVIHVTNHSSSSLVKSPSVTVGHKYVNIHRHQLLILSKINNGWSMAVTVLQRKASTQQIGLLLMPAIKGAVYINTHSNYSQPELTKYYRMKILVGILTPLHWYIIPNFIFIWQSERRSQVKLRSLKTAISGVFVAVSRKR